MQKSATRKYFSYFKSLFSKSIFLFSYNGENYIKIDESKYSHGGSVGNLEGQAITTGGGAPCGGAPHRKCYVKTEILDMTTMTWSDADDYPYGR